MALPLPPGLTPSEIAFVCEMELVTVIPRQRLEALELLGGSTQALHPPHRAPLPLWLALLLKRQKRANILPPPWLHPNSLEAILDQELKIYKESFSPPMPLPSGLNPPFAPSATAEASSNALPYHWLELGEILLEAAPDDIVDPDTVRRMMRDLREIRMAKLRAGVSVLDSGQVQVTGIGGMEVGEGRGFITEVMNRIRKIEASREQAEKEKDDAEDDDMDI